jgi:hypothetical protein
VPFVLFVASFAATIHSEHTIEESCNRSVNFNDIRKAHEVMRIVRDD